MQVPTQIKSYCKPLVEAAHFPVSIMQAVMVEGEEALVGLELYLLVEVMVVLEGCQQSRGAMPRPVTPH